MENFRISTKGRSGLELKDFYKELYVDQHVPFCIQRTEDDALLLLNNDFRTYSFENDLSDCFSFTYNELRKHPEAFKVLSYAPIENLFNKPKQYFKKESQLKVNYRIKFKNENIKRPTNRKI